jgi:cytochrome c553
MRSIAKPMRIAIQMAVVLCCAAGMASALAQSATAGKSVVTRGEQLSKLLCPSCHVVATNQEFAPILRQPTPSFTEIANRPDTSVASLQRFISTTHWDEKTIPMQMPNPGLSKEEMKAVTAYILSLRKP